MITLYIDGDGIAYRCGFAVEKTKYLVQEQAEYGSSTFAPFDNAKEARAHAESKNVIGAKIWSRKEVEPLGHAIALVDSVLSNLYDRFGTKSGVLFLTPSVGNFRDAIATYAKYKGNRDAAPRPTYYRELYSHLIETYGATYATGQEADDSLGIALTQDPQGVCVSLDKDLLQVPGRHYNWVDKSETVVSKKTGSLNFWTQVIAGDPTDNVPGCEAMGPIKAGRALADCRSDAEAWKVALKIYKEKYGEEEGTKRAIETARLVYIRRRPEEVWAPPN